MSISPQTPQPAAQKANRRKKARAVMASGLVLGVGAAVTLAAWSDTAWGVSEFGTGDSAFNIQASFDGTTWDEFMTDKTAGTMDFGTKATGMVPGEPIYAVVGLREQHNKMDANITLTKVTADSTAIGEYITVGVSAPLSAEPTTCAGVATAATAKLDSANQVMSEFTLAGGATKWFCLSATLDTAIPANTAPTKSDAIQWKFDGASVEKEVDVPESTTPAAKP